MKVKYIQIKDANKKFRKHMFKMCGHDFLRIWRHLLSLNLTERELAVFSKWNHEMMEKYGDYEVLVKVLKNKIKITNMEGEI